MDMHDAALSNSVSYVNPASPTISILIMLFRRNTFTMANIPISSNGHFLCSIKSKITSFRDIFLVQLTCVRFKWFVKDLDVKYSVIFKTFPYIPNYLLYC